MKITFRYTSFVIGIVLLILFYFTFRNLINCPWAASGRISCTVTPTYILLVGGIISFFFAFITPSAKLTKSFETVAVTVMGLTVLGIILQWFIPSLITYDAWNDTYIFLLSGTLASVACGLPLQGRASHIIRPILMLNILIFLLLTWLLTR